MDRGDTLNDEPGGPLQFPFSPCVRYSLKPWSLSHLCASCCPCTWNTEAKKTLFSSSVGLQSSEETNLCVRAKTGKRKRHWDDRRMKAKRACERLPGAGGI